MYNELSQVLCMHALFYKSSQSYKQMHTSIEPNASDHEIEFGQIRQLDNIVRWYTKHMQIGDSIHLTLKKYDHQLRTMLM